MSTTFSFFSPGLVRTGKLGHAFVFTPNQDETYIYLRTLAVGAQSRAQLVAKTSGNHEVVIRKEEREIRILNLLASFVHDPALTPRWTTCLAHENVAVTTGGPESTMLWAARVSYWKLCNNGSLADWLARWNEGNLPKGLVLSDASSQVKSLKELPFPVAPIARCIAQIAETLHIMYQAGDEPVYHCDLHIANIFMHLDNPHDDADTTSPLPDFYIGDFGLARTATEAHADDVAVYGDWDPNEDMSPLRRHESPPGPGAVFPTGRRRWDMLRFVSGLQSLVQLATQPTPPNGPTPTTSTKPQADGLRKLMKAIDFLDAQDQMLAARNPQSRPPSLVEVAREARRLEADALAAERETLQLRAFVALARRRGKHLVTAGSPFVLAPREGVMTTHAAARARADEYAKENIGGGWTVVDSV